MREILPRSAHPLSGFDIPVISPSQRVNTLPLMRRFRFILGALTAFALGQASTVSAQTVFVNGFRIPGNILDATNQPGANGGRFGFFSDIYYDPTLNQWWALSDRGPGGGLITYDTRLSRFEINVHPITGAISQFRVIKTITFTDPDSLLAGPGPALNGLNPLDLNGSESVLGHSFDPEGLVIDPNTGEFIVADEYGPSVYVFDRQGRLVRVFEVPENLVPFVGATVNYVALRDACGGASPLAVVRRQRRPSGQPRVRRPGGLA